MNIRTRPFNRRYINSYKSKHFDCYEFTFKISLLAVLKTCDTPDYVHGFTSLMNGHFSVAALMSDHLVAFYYICRLGIQQLIVSLE